jgi:hypothetical protein
MQPRAIAAIWRRTILGWPSTLIRGGLSWERGRPSSKVEHAATALGHASQFLNGERARERAAERAASVHCACNGVHASRTRDTSFSIEKHKRRGDSPLPQRRLASRMALAFDISTGVSRGLALRGEYRLGYCLQLRCASSNHSFLPRGRSNSMTPDET